MKFILVEDLSPTFDSELELEYEAEELCGNGSCSGTVTYTVDPTDVLDSLWDFMVKDKNPPLTKELFEIFAHDDDAYINYIEENFDMLVNRYINNFYNKFEDFARDYMDQNIERYAVDGYPSQREIDTREFWRNVWG